MFLIFKLLLKFLKSQILWNLIHSVLHFFKSHNILVCQYFYEFPLSMLFARVQIQLQYYYNLLQGLKEGHLGLILDRITVELV